MSLFDVPWFRKPARPVLPPNHWEGCDDAYYVWDYRPRLDTLARELHVERGGSPVFTRFNREKKAAEVLTHRNGIIAQVNVHGSEGLAYEAVVRLADPTLEVRFQEMFRGLPLKFLPLTP